MEYISKTEGEEIKDYCFFDKRPVFEHKLK